MEAGHEGVGRQTGRGHGQEGGGGEVELRKAKVWTLLEWRGCILELMVVLRVEEVKQSCSIWWQLLILGRRLWSCFRRLFLLDIWLRMLRTVLRWRRIMWTPRGRRGLLGNFL